MNTLLLLQEMRSYSAHDKMTTLFIDLKSAYNTVNRQTLFRIIRDKQILPSNESLFLELLYNSIYFTSAGGKRHYLLNGVH